MCVCVCVYVYVYVCVCVCGRWVWISLTLCCPQPSKHAALSLIRKVHLLSSPLFSFPLLLSFSPVLISFMSALISLSFLLFCSSLLLFLPYCRPTFPTILFYLSTTFTFTLSFVFFSSQNFLPFFFLSHLFFSLRISFTASLSTTTINNNIK
jgi:hypothetical protein